MASRNILHSNAFNFQSFIQRSVDPRTGQYTLGIALPALIGNDLAGPQLPLRLRFSPMNDEDSGFGKGWNLSLTQYVPGTHMLTLHTGEVFKVTGSGAQPDIREKKLDTFHFHDDNQHPTAPQDRYRVVHKSGLVEVLTKQAGTSPVYLVTEVYSRSRHKVSLDYGPSTGYLERISYRDRDNVLCKLLALTYATGGVTIDVHPDADPGKPARARYTLEMSNRELHKVTLPTADLANWRIAYATIKGLTCVTKLHSPSGAVETIAYEDDGHVLPVNGERVAIPRVTTHTLDPGAGQKPTKTTYTYLYVDPETQQSFDHNFVGYNSGITWSNDGEDNLFRAQSSYKYGSTAHIWSLDQDGKEVELRTVEQVYNRFHLMEAEITRQAGHVQSVFTEYHGDVTKPWGDQLGNFQLPKVSTRKWELLDKPGKSRSEETTTVYNPLGNLIEEIQPNGQRVVNEYYAAEGEDGCPPDPELFERSLKHSTVIPAPQGDAPAPVLRTGYRYRALATVGGEAETWLVQEQISLCEVIDDVEQPPLQVTRIEPVDDVADLLRHGRPLKQTLDMKGCVTTQSFSYEKEKVDVREVVDKKGGGGEKEVVVRKVKVDEQEQTVQEPALVTEQTITGYDHGNSDADTGLPRNTVKVITSKHSILTGEPLLNRDDKDIEIAYTYDALNRTTSETVSPNQPDYTASRFYEYYLVGSEGQQASQTSTDVKGVSTTAWVDGLSRVVSELRHDADAGDSGNRRSLRLRYEASYDELGQLLEQTDYDWLADQQMPLKTRYRYDNWGQRCCEIGPDGVRHYEQTDPIGTSESGNLPIQTSWSASANGKLTQGKTVTYLNLFEQPDVVQRFDRTDKVLSKHQYFYDGLGRTVREVDARNAETKNVYDVFDRLVDQTLADRKSVVHRDYAPHSSVDLPVKIAVNGAVLGEQTFDGLDRMTASITGGRKRVMFYEAGQTKPWKVRTPANREIEYDYTLQLTDQPEVRRVLPAPGQTQKAAVEEYKYDRKNARLTYCGEPGQEVARDYFSTGELKLETRTVGSESWSMTYGASLQGRALTYEDVLGQTQHYKYDKAGRLEKTWLGGLRTTFDYDDLGNLKSYKTCDGIEGEDEDEAACERWLLTELEYDDLGREELRRFTFPGSVQELTQKYSALDQLTLRTLTENGELLREETYSYDLRGRLEGYTCKGPQAPQDPCGKTIREQQFLFDSIDNITWVYTAFDGAGGKQDSNEATYLFENEADPAQLTGIENTHADYLPSVTLTYDPDGNMTTDEQGRTYDYDPLGRLQSVKLLDGTVAGYGYDSLDRLASQDS
ncbi:RHS repeat protein [Pseudomonas monteilii]|uniref:Sugar-binding protein n=2 Tax=Pseudomonas TaxID=286 RepID=A0AAP7FRW5_9PSED|nr:MULTISPECIES: RHS repeat protein [Pseudomonas]AYN15115.1 RHS repeat protein [Pseudomonas monteilii]AYO02816.1 RHS repeat protein [Pseudomonas sp. LTGT-11-2Z]MBA6101260.1 RHS repeat protein [Pseudomonas monteilii]MCE0876672.1 RHS repeat protein [Pseudomonas monteilii]MCE0929158.1 RHS repeat protein [Pseudomonas monteilii]